MKKSSVVVPTRQDGAAAKLTVARPDSKLQSKASGTPEKRMSRLLSRTLITQKNEEESPRDEAGGRKNSFLPSGSSRPSISAGSGSRLSIVGLMAGRRFAKKLLSRANDKRESTIGGDGPPPVLYENTYRMQPKVKFQPNQVLEVVKDVIDSRVQNMKYSPRIAANMNRILADEVKDRVKKLNYERYKIVVMVMIGENAGQGIQVSSRCSWDDQLDSFVTHTCKNKDIFCTCSVYGTYTE